MLVEFPPEVNLTTIPESILTIPFAGVMLSVACLFGCSVRVKAIDKKYQSCISKVEDSFKQYMPHVKLPFRLYADLTEENQMSGDRCSLFFTGGLDASSALTSVIDQKPLLINIWGGDVPIADMDSHTSLDNYLSRLSSGLGLQYCFIKSNARELFDEPALDKRCREKVGRKNNHGWWASVAHILNMVSLIAPMNYSLGITTHYVGSSYNKNDLRAFDANNPYLTNSIAFASCRTALIDDSLSRSQKAEKIMRYVQTSSNPFELRVCWYRKAGQNCSHCENCYRTIMDIIVNGGNPNDFGFRVDEASYRDIEAYLKNSLINKGYWEEVQDEFRKKPEKWSSDPRVSWFLDMRFNTIRIYAKILKRRITRKLK